MNWKQVGQLAMVHVGVSITVVPVTSTLNRIMIADMHLSALLVGFLIALPYLLSPLQVFMGEWTDRTLFLGTSSFAMDCDWWPHGFFRGLLDATCRLFDE